MVGLDVDSNEFFDARKDGGNIALESIFSHKEVGVDLALALKQNSITDLAFALNSG